MKSGSFSDPPSKRLLRRAYGAALTLQTFATARRRGGPARVWYGGARAGEVGGTLVKLKRLTARFPEHRRDYNLVYLLSNTPYLGAMALRRLRARGVPVVLNQNGVFYPGWYEGDWRAMNARMAIGYHAADHVFWQSSFCRAAAEEFLGSRNGAGEILFNGVDTVRFAPQASAERSGPFTFLMTGKFDRDRGYRLTAAIGALAIGRREGLDARLVIAGWIDAGVEAALEAQIANEGLRNAVDRLGPYTQQDAPAVYGSADAYLTLAYLDPCPNAVIEALACGLPVLFSDSGGVPELVGPHAGIGLKVPQSWEEIHVPSAQAIATGMFEIMKGRAAMGRAARARAVAAFDINAWLARHDAVFQRLVGTSR